MTKTDIVDITDEIRAELKRLKKRSGAGVAALLRGQQENMPEGLSAAMIEHWLTKAKSVRRDHLDFVVELWSRDPVYMDVTPDMLDTLERKATRVRLHMKYAKDLPFGLNWIRVTLWLTGKTKRIKTVHWEYVSRIE